MHERERAANVQNRIADRITMFAGSMAFVYIHIVWFGSWIALGVEHYPYGLLTMIVSLEAIFLSTFVMISQNRADGRRALLAAQEYQAVQLEEKQNEELIALSNRILRSHDGHPSDRAATAAGGRAHARGRAEHLTQGVEGCADPVGELAELVGVDHQRRRDLQRPGTSARVRMPASRHAVTSLPGSAGSSAIAAGASCTAASTPAPARTSLDQRMLGERRERRRQLRLEIPRPFAESLAFHDVQVRERGGGCGRVAGVRVAVPPDAGALGPERLGDPRRGDRPLPWAGSRW